MMTKEWQFKPIYEKKEESFTLTSMPTVAMTTLMMTLMEENNTTYKAMEGHCKIKRKNQLA